MVVGVGFYGEALVRALRWPRGTVRDGTVPDDWPLVVHSVWRRRCRLGGLGQRRGRFTVTPAPAR